MTEEANASVPNPGDAGLSAFEIDLIRHRLGMPVNRLLADFPQQQGTTEKIASILTNLYESVGLRNFPLPGKPPHRGAFSTGVVVMTGQGFVVGQRTSENYRTPGPTLQSDPILTTPDALRIANEQRPGLTPHLLHNEGERLMITSYEFGVHAEQGGTPGGAVVRNLLLQGLPEALAEFTTMRVPPEVRRHQQIDSVRGVIARARHLRDTRFSTKQLSQTAEFGIDLALLEDLDRRAAAFTPRATGILHNDIHYENVLLRPTVVQGEIRSQGVCILDLQLVTEGDPIQDLACSAVLLDTTMPETVDMTEEWCARLPPAHTDGVERDLSTAIAAVAATRSVVAIPNAIKKVQKAAEQDRSHLEQVVEEAAERVHVRLAPAMAYGRDTQVTREEVGTLLAATIPRNPSMIAGAGLGPASGVRSSPDATPHPSPTTLHNSPASRREVEQKQRSEPSLKLDKSPTPG